MSRRPWALASFWMTFSVRSQGRRPRVQRHLAGELDGDEGEDNALLVGELLNADLEDAFEDDTLLVGELLVAAPMLMSFTKTITMTISTAHFSNDGEADAQLVGEPLRDNIVDVTKQAGERPARARSAK